MYFQVHIYSGKILVETAGRHKYFATKALRHKGKQSFLARLYLIAKEKSYRVSSTKVIQKEERG
jgi:hypothetical protein